jgi:hypothetical protein
MRKIFIILLIGISVLSNARVLKFDGVLLRLDSDVPNHLKLRFDSTSVIGAHLYDKVNGVDFPVVTGTITNEGGIKCLYGGATGSNQDLGTQNTIVVWFKDMQDSTRNILGRNATTQYSLRLTTAYTITYRAFAGAPYNVFANSAPFEQLVIVRNGTSLSLYLDGVFSETITDAGLTTSTIIATIGGNLCKDNFNEIILEKSMWTIEDIKAYYNRTVLGGNLDQYNLLNMAGQQLHNTAMYISDLTDLYSHESQILMYRGSSYTRFYKIICWLENKTDQNENHVAQSGRLKIYNALTNALVYDTVFIKGNTDYGSGIVTGNTGVLAPRMWIYGNTLSLVGTVDYKVYKRTLDLTTLSLSSMGYFNVTIYGGSSVALDSLTARQHLEGITGTTSGMFKNATVMIRGNDNVKVIGSDWYLVCETMHYPGGDFAAVPMLMKSSNNGTSWTLLNPIYFPTYATGFCETSIIWNDNKWNALARRADIDGRAYWYMSSSDGITWTEPVKSNLKGIGTRHSVTWTKDENGDTVVLIAYNKFFRGFSVYRNVLSYAETYDYQTFTDILIINNPYSCHYPCVTNYNNTIYSTYTTGDKNVTAIDRDGIKQIQFVKGIY